MQMYVLWNQCSGTYNFWIHYEYFFYFREPLSNFEILSSFLTLNIVFKVEEAILIKGSRALNFLLHLKSLITKILYSFLGY